MMSLYDVTESVTVITVPKDRRNGARYGLTACVCVCVGRWSSSHESYLNIECFLKHCKYQQGLEEIKNEFPAG